MTKLIINDTQHALRQLAFRLGSSGTCFIYFDIGSNVLKKSGPCKVGAEQRYFWAGGSSFHLNLVELPKTCGATSRRVYSSQTLLEL